MLDLKPFITKLHKAAFSPAPDFADQEKQFPIWLSKAPDEITTTQMNQLRNSAATFNPDDYDTGTATLIQGRIDAALLKFNVGEFRKAIDFVPFQKNEDRQIIYGVVLRPNFQDFQGDMIPENDVENAAHRWMMNGQKLDWQHKELIDKAKVVPVESYLAPVDFEVNGYEIKKGDWVMAVHVLDKMLWSGIKDGKTAMAFSITGRGRRIKV